jgi:hypothetical protein
MNEWQFRTHYRHPQVLLRQSTNSRFWVAVMTHLNLLRLSR